MKIKTNSSFAEKKGNNIMLNKKEILKILNDNTLLDEEKIEQLQDEGMELEDILQFVLMNY